MNGYFTAILLCSIFKTIKKWAALSFCLNMMNRTLVSMRLSLYYQRVKSRWWRKVLCLDKWGLAESLGNLPSCINAHEQPVWKVNYMFWWIKMPSRHNFFVAMKWHKITCFETILFLLPYNSEPLEWPTQQFSHDCHWVEINKYLYIYI